MKKLLKFVFMLLAVFGITTAAACTEEPADQPTVETPVDQNQTVVDKVANDFVLSVTTVSGNFSLPTTAKGGVTITWTSDSENIAISGQTATVTRPSFEDGDKTVTLTAVFKLGEATATKTYTVVVEKAEDVNQIEASTVAEALAAEVGASLTVRGIVSAYHVGSQNYPDSKQGFYLTDATGSIYVYGYALAAEVSVGDDIVITATKDEYKNTDQLKNPNLSQTVSSGNAIPRDAANTEVTIGDLANDLTNVDYYGLYVIFENVTVKKIDGGTYVSYTLLDSNGNEVNLYSGGNSSEFAVYDQYIGKSLKVSYMVNGQNSKATKWRGHIVEVIEVLGDFTPGQGGNTGGETGGEVPSETSTVAEALAAATNTSVTVKGIVAGFHWGTYNSAPSAQGCYIADTTGIIYVFGYAVAQNVSVGDEVVITATKAEYNGAQQLSNPTLNSTVSTGNAIPRDYATTNVDLATVANDLNGDYLGKAFVFTGVSIVKVTGDGYVSYTVEDANGNAVNLYSSGDSSEFASLDQYIGKTIDLLYVVNGKNSKGTKWRGHALEVLAVNGDNTGGETPDPGQGGETPDVPEGQMTIAQALAASEGTEVVIQGTVTGIYQAYDSGYNNISVYVTDATGKILAFRLTGNVNIHDVIIVTGKVTNYNGTMQIAQGGTYVLVETEECSEFTDATCKNPALCVACGKAKDDVTLDHTFENGVCTECGDLDPDYEGEVVFPSVESVLSLAFSDAANKADGDSYFKTNYPDWTITGKLGQTYGGYLGFGRSGDKTSAITSSKFTASSDFRLTVVAKGNGSNGVATSTLTFEVLDHEGNVIATSQTITPADAKDTTYTIEFNYVSGKSYVDAAQVRVNFSKSTGNIGLKSLSVVL